MSRRAIFQRLLGYLKEHRLSLFLCILSAVISTAFLVLAPFLVGRVTTALFASIADGVFYWDTILWLLAALVALYLISQLFTFLQGFGMARITAHVMQKLRSDIDGKMHRLKLDYYDTHTHGDILSVITNDVDTINNAISQNLTSVVTQITTAVGVLVMMLAISPALTVIPVVMVPLSMLSAAGMMKASETYYGQQQDLLGALNGYVEEMYNGQQVVQAFNHQKQAKAEFRALNEALRDSARKAEVTAGSVSPITTLVNDMGYVVCAAIGVKRCSRRAFCLSPPSAASGPLRGSSLLAASRPCWSTPGGLPSPSLLWRAWWAASARLWRRAGASLPFWTPGRRSRIPSPQPSPGSTAAAWSFTRSNSAIPRTAC